MVREHFPERRHAVDGIAVVEGVFLRLELQDFPHLLVGIDKFAFFVVESQSHETLVEDLTIAVCHLHLFLVTQDLLCLISECTEEVGGDLHRSIGIFRNADIMDVVPVSQMLFFTPVPSEGALGGLHTTDEFLHALNIEVLVFRVDVFQTLLIAHASLRQEVAVHVGGMSFLNGEAYHVVVACMKGLLHDG